MKLSNFSFWPRPSTSHGKRPRPSLACRPVETRPPRNGRTKILQGISGLSRKRLGLHFSLSVARASRGALAGTILVRIRARRRTDALLYFRLPPSSTPVVAHRRNVRSIYL